MSERCFWCNVDPDAAAARREGPHLKWCLRYRHTPLPAGLKRMTIGGIPMLVIENSLMPPGEIGMSCGPEPKQNVKVTGLSVNGSGANDVP